MKGRLLHNILRRFVVTCAKLLPKEMKKYTSFQWNRNKNIKQRRKTKKQKQKKTDVLRGRRLKALTRIRTIQHSAQVMFTKDKLKQAFRFIATVSK